MKNKPSLYLYSIALIFIVLSGCKKSSDNSTPTSNTVTDADGNVYHWISIGPQVWLVENLKTTRFNDGTSIPLVSDDTWGSLSTPAYCFYGNDQSQKQIYGALYNWFAVETGKLAPQGWRVATDADWAAMITYLGGELLAGGKLKSTGTVEQANGLWLGPNTGATNSSGFKGFPGGYRGNISFNDINVKGHWWTSTVNGTSTAWGYDLHHDSTAVFRIYNPKTEGRSVRCIKIQ
jgi:uncharacterized protein (TIGR02145 family)